MKKRCQRTVSASVTVRPGHAKTGLWTRLSSPSPKLYPRSRSRQSRSGVSLACPEVREQADILDSNIFLFAATHKSSVHVIGWHSVNRVCRARQRNSDTELARCMQVKMFLKVSGKFSISTWVTRQRLYTNVYQAPLAESEIRMVGSFLLSVDKPDKDTDSGCTLLFIICKS